MSITLRMILVRCATLQMTTVQRAFDATVFDNVMSLGETVAKLSSPSPDMKNIYFVVEIQLLIKTTTKIEY